MSWNWLLQKCPRCGAWHDDGVLIQTEDKNETEYVCHECADEFYESEEE